MTVTPPATAPLADRLFAMNIAAYETACVYLGDRLGLYRALDALGRATPEELASRAGTDARYTREWLEQQAVAGVLRVDGGRFSIAPEDRETLVDPDSLAHLVPLARFTAGVYSGLPKLLRAFRSGEGVAYVDFGEDAREGQADVNRTLFVNLLGKEWFPALPDVHARLSDPRGARVADVACGTGWSSVSIARAYPHARVDGYDLDGPSIELARANAKTAGLDGRVRFQQADAADPQAEGAYDLVTIFEAVHDMARPVDALRACRGMLAPGGSVIVADERAAETFAAPGPLSERLYYGWSVLFCLPTSREEAHSAATGTAMRPATMRDYATRAGFSRAEVLPIENDLWRFYRLWP